MKKAIFTIVVCLSVGFVGAASVRHHDQYKNKQISTQQAVVDDLTKKNQAYEAGQVKLIARYNDLRVECEKGQAAYDALTTSQKTKTPDPTCGTVLIK